jgi:outer membrane protein OmpU
MNKLLLGTTALVGASLLVSGAAYAAKPKVKVSGDIEVTAGGSDQDIEDKAFGGAAGPGSAGPTRGYGFRTNSEVRINGSGKTDAGMKWKAEVQFEVDTNVGASDSPTESSIDETWVRFSGSWGKVELGNQDGVEDGYLVGGDKAVSKAGDGGIDGNWQDFIDARPANGRLFDEPDDNLDSSDATKISYFTPRVGGVSAAVSFTPDTGARGQATDRDNNGDNNNTWGIGVDFKKKIDKVKVLVSGAIHLGDSEDESEEDLFTWGVGALVGFGGWQIAGGYVDNGDSNQDKAVTDDNDATSWSAGLGYSQGPVHLGVSYLHSEVEDGANGDDESDTIVLGATYMLGGGARVFTDLFWLDQDDASGSSSNEGVGFLVGAQVKF